MAAKLGNADASFRLGSVTPEAVYLGTVQVFSSGPTPRTLYFTGAVDSDWDELGNWFDDAEGEVAASSLPTAADSIVDLSGGISINSGSVPTVVNATFNDPNEAFGGVGIAIIVTGIATFNDGTSLTQNGTITGNATFNDSSRMYGTVTGTATFNDSASNDGGTAGTFVPNPPPSG
jgi:hypothetical protein